MTERYAVVVAVHLILEQEGKILLGLRQNTKWGDGFWHLPAGHMEEGETVLAAMQREALEEVGITIRERDMEFVSVMHRQSEGATRMDLFFRVTAWEGEVRNAEPEKCERLEWFAVDALPEPMVAYAKEALAAWQRGERMLLNGWDEA